ncbi:MAG: hypothetical protein ACTSPB_23660 [Candidatus Thorarchaeota archaeon]
MKLKASSKASLFILIVGVALLSVVLSTFIKPLDDCDKVVIVYNQVTIEDAGLDGDLYFVNYSVTVGNIHKDSVMFMFEVNILGPCSVLIADTLGPYILGPAPAMGKINEFTTIDYCIKHNMTGIDLVVTEIERWKKVK